VSIEADSLQVVPFSVDASTFKEELLKWLMEGDYTPNDILGRVFIQEHIGIYLPLYRYQGTFESSFTAHAGFDRVEQFVEHVVCTNDRGQIQRMPVTRSRKTIDWRPVSSKLRTDFAFVCTAGQRLPAHWSDFCEEASAEQASSRVPLDLILAHENTIVTFEQTGEEVFDARAKAKLWDIVQTEIKNRMPGDHHKDLDIQWSQESTSSQIYHPFWMASFPYNGVIYLFLMDGCDETKFRGNRPVDMALRARVDALFQPLQTAAMFWLIIGFFGLFFALIPTIAALLLGIPHILWLYNSANREKNDILTRSRTTRESALARLKKQDEEAG